MSMLSISSLFGLPSPLAYIHAYPSQYNDHLLGSFRIVMLPCCNKRAGELALEYWKVIEIFWEDIGNLVATAALKRGTF